MKHPLLLLWVLVFFAPGLTASEAKTVTLKVDHLACLSCAEKFKEELSSVCKDLTLDVTKGEAVCRYEDPVTPKQILKKANKTGLPTKCVGEVSLDN